MKSFSATVATLLVASPAANAFVPPQQCRSMAHRPLHAGEAGAEQENKIPPLPAMSQALPFLPRPSALTGEFAGDVGFDPLNFATTPDKLIQYREAEIKHARLAMLAAAGWPTSEIFDGQLASVVGLPSDLDASDRVPSLLNGGLEKISPLYWALVFIIGAVLELAKMQKTKEDDYVPGDYGFDPLGLYPTAATDRKQMQLAEIKHGRLSMIAITAFAVQEAVSKEGVVDETPFFFRPVTEWGAFMSTETQEDLFNIVL